MTCCECQTVHSSLPRAHPPALPPSSTSSDAASLYEEDGVYDPEPKGVSRQGDGVAGGISRRDAEDGEEPLLDTPHPHLTRGRRKKRILSMRGMDRDQMPRHTGDPAQAVQVAVQVAVRPGEAVMPVAAEGAEGAEVAVAASASLLGPRDPAWEPPDDKFRYASESWWWWW